MERSDKQKSIEELLEKETQDIEHKRCFDFKNSKSMSAFIKCIAAISNIGGGFIVVGVDDSIKKENKKIIGVEQTDLDKYKSDTLQNYANKYITPSPRIISWSEKYSGKDLIVIHVIPFEIDIAICKNFGETDSKIRDGDIFIRRGTQSIRALSYEVNSLLNKIIDRKLEEKLSMIYKSRLIDIDSKEKQSIYLRNSSLDIHGIHKIYQFRNEINPHTLEIGLIIKSIILDENSSKCGWFWLKEGKSLDTILLNFIHGLSTEEYAKGILFLKHINLTGTNLLRLEKHLESYFESQENNEHEKEQIVPSLLKMLSSKGSTVALNRSKNLIHYKNDNIRKTALEINFQKNLQLDANLALSLIIEWPEELGKEERNIKSIIENVSNKEGLKKLLDIKSVSNKVNIFKKVKDILSEDDILNLLKESNKPKLIFEYFLELLNRGYDDTEYVKRTFEKI